MVAALVVMAAAGVSGCRRRVPDVGAFTPVLEEDGRIVELLMEADALGDHDPRAAARNLRELVLLRAQANWHSAAGIVVGHPRANVLRVELVRLTGERASTIEAYAVALEAGDLQALHDVVHRQAMLDRAMERLEGAVQAATRVAPDRACGVSRVSP